MNGVMRMTRGLDRGFRQKFENFLSFQFLAKSASKIKCVWQYSGKQKKVFLDSKIRKSKKLNNCDFSKGVSPWSWSKIWNFSMFLFLAKPNRKTCLKIFWEGKKAFLCPKIRKLKKSKNQDFSKGVSLWFQSKIGNFSMILFLSKSNRKTCLKIF